VRLIRRLLQRLLAGPPVALPTEPIPQSWYRVLERRVPLSSRLDVHDRTRLLRLAQLFVRDVPIEGCAGLAMTDEIRVTIAATASLLLLGLPYPRFLRLRRVLVYPDTFVPVRIASYRSQGLQEAPVAELGEAWRDGMVVLSWNDITAGGTDPEDGRNVILHEFAHVLDFEDGASDGLPIMDSEQARVAWSAVLQAEFARQQEAATREEDATLDSYAATNRAEFFAVATETFFERGAHLRERLPDLYEQLRLFYRQDPASRTGLGGA
jgi:Mlc titration factor MtfA (ptsG expression regulator)